MHELSIYEIKRICHRAYFFHNLVGKFSAFDQFSKKKYERVTLVLNIELKLLLSAASFFLLTKIIAHDIKPSRKCASLAFIPYCDKILHDIYIGQFVEN